MLKTAISRIRKRLSIMAAPKALPEFILFGDSLTEWSFSEKTEGFGLFLERSYADTVTIVNEGS